MAIEKNHWCLKYVPGHFKTEKMCKKVVEDDPYTLEFVPDHLNMKMCNKAVRIEPPSLVYIPYHFKTQDICDKTVKDNPYSLFLIRLLQESG